MSTFDSEDQGYKSGSAFDTILAISCVLLFILLLILAVIYFNYYRLWVILYIGWAAIFTGFITGGKASRDYLSKPKIKPDEPGVRKTSSMYPGTYRIIRHPVYGSFILIIVGLMMLTQYWVSLITGTVLILLLYLAILREEEYKLRKLGIRYRAYMKKVPRLNILRKFFSGK